MIKMRTEDLLGRAITELYPTEDIPLLLEFIGRRESQGRAQYEFYIRQANGGRLPVAVTARQVRTADGHLFGIVTATDISEQKRVQMELRKSNSLLLARQRQTLSSTATEARTGGFRGIRSNRRAVVRLKLTRAILAIFR